MNKIYRTSMVFFLSCAFIALSTMGLSKIAFSMGKKTLPKLDVVDHVDINQYLGTWYEIARLPNSFQKGCSDTTATYNLKDKLKIEVLNRCLKGDEWDEVHGTAKIIDTVTNAKLKVTFFWPFSGDYWIIRLAEDYSYALVGEPSREYLWILSRSPQMNQKTYTSLVSYAQDQGFDTTQLLKTEHNFTPSEPKS